MEPEQVQQWDSDIIDLRRLWAGIWRRRMVILSMTVLGILVAYIITATTTPIYEAVATLLIKDPRAAGERMFLESGESVTTRNQVQNSVQLLRTRQVALAAAQRLGYTFEPTDGALTRFQSSISVQPVANTETIRVLVTHPSPGEAAAIANAVAESFIALNRQLSRGEVTAAREFIEEQLVVAQAQLQAAEQALQEYRLTHALVSPTEEMRVVLTQLVELEARHLETERALQDARGRAMTADVNRYTTLLATLREQIQRAEERLAVLPEKEMRLAALTRERDVLEQVFLMLRSRLEEVRIAEAMRTPEVAVIDPAVPPRNPIRPRRALNLGLGILLGLVFGVGLALLLEYMDTTVKSPDQVEELLGVPVLGRIPMVQTRANGR